MENINLQNGDCRKRTCFKYILYIYKDERIDLNDWMKFFISYKTMMLWKSYMNCRWLFISRFHQFFYLCHYRNDFGLILTISCFWFLFLFYLWLSLLLAWKYWLWPSSSQTLQFVRVKKPTLHLSINLPFQKFLKSIW